MVFTKGKIQGGIFIIKKGLISTQFEGVEYLESMGGAVSWAHYLDCPENSIITANAQAKTECFFINK